MMLLPDETALKLLSVSDLQVILTPHMRRLARCVWPVWGRYLAIPEVDRFAYDLVAEANVLNRYMIDYAKREFADIPGVQWLEDDGFVLVFEGFPYGIDGQVAARFKKLDASGKSKNNLGTARARAIRGNNNDLLEGMPPSATWVDIGPTMNGLRTGFAEVQAIRLIDTRFIMSIPRESDGTISFPTSFNTPEGGNPAQRFIVIPRREQRGTPENETPDK